MIVDPHYPGPWIKEHRDILDRNARDRFWAPYVSEYTFRVKEEVFTLHVRGPGWVVMWREMILDHTRDVFIHDWLPSNRDDGFRDRTVLPGREEALGALQRVLSRLDEDRCVPPADD